MIIFTFLDLFRFFLSFKIKKKIDKHFFWSAHHREI